MSNEQTQTVIETLENLLMTSELDLKRGSFLLSFGLCEETGELQMSITTGGDGVFGYVTGPAAKFADSEWTLHDTLKAIIERLTGKRRADAAKLPKVPGARKRT